MVHAGGMFVQLAQLCSSNHLATLYTVQIIISHIDYVHTMHVYSYTVNMVIRRYSTCVTNRKTLSLMA